MKGLSVTSVRQLRLVISSSLLVSVSAWAEPEPIAAPAAQSSLPPKLMSSPLTEHYQQTQLSIQQQRLDNELAQLQRDYAQLQLQRQQHQQALKQLGQSSRAANNNTATGVAARPGSLGQLVSEVRYPQLHLTLYQQAQSWRWQRRRQSATDPN
ncbi:MAG: hypothetical protein ACQEQZ_04130 [Pseudomonadota bacterium]